jgi:ORF6N domain
MDYQGVLVVTTYRLSKIYKCSAETLIWSYLQHKDQFVEGVQYYELTSEEFKNCEQRYPQEFVDCMSPYLWTFEGMYKHAKVLTGIEAWRAYMNFVYCYFQQSEELKQAIRLLEKASNRVEDLYIYHFDEKELQEL